MKFKDKLKSYRIEKGMTQEELATKSKVSRTAIASWEQGYRSPRMEAVIRIAEVLKVAVIDLLDDDTPKSFDILTANQEQTLIDSYRSLNDEGKRTLLTFAQSLVYNPLYGNGEGTIKDAFMYDGAKDQKTLEDLTENEKAALANRPPNERKEIKEK